MINQNTITTKAAQDANKQAEKLTRSTGISSNTPKRAAADLSKWDRVIEKSERPTMAIKHDAKANDNDSPAWQDRLIAGMKMTGFIIVAAFIMVQTASSYSNMITQTMLQANNKTLMTAMKTNPEALSFALNAMNIGE